MSRFRQYNEAQGSSPRPFRSSKVVFLTTVFALAVCLTGCGKSGGGNLHVKSAGTGEKEILQRSAYAFAVTKSFTDISGKISTAPSYRVYVANYDLDSSFFGQTLNKPLTSDDQIQIVFSLVGDEGGTEKTPTKAGTYSANADKFMKVEDVSILARKGGADNKQWLDRKATSGEVTVSSVAGDAISGEINLTSGEMSIKGPFTAKILVRK